MNVFSKLLLGTAIVMAPGLASAQSVPAETWAIGNISGTSSNTAAVSLTGNLDDGPTITAGTSNSISAAAVGASASNGVTMISENGSGAPTGTTVTFGTVTLTANNDAPALGSATVSATTDILGAEIGGGNSNAISGAAVGASASFAVNSVVTGASIPGTEVIAGAVDLTASNENNVTFEGNLGTTNTAGDAPVIVAGTSNSISAAAVGASGSLSFAGSASGTSAGTETVTIGATDIDVTNDGDVTLGDATDLSSAFAAEITDGTSNSISLAGVGSSASLSIGTYGDGASDSKTEVTVGNVTLDSTNNGDVDVNGALGKTGVSADAPSIDDGTLNSISVAGVGASSSSSYTSINSGTSNSNADVGVGTMSSGATNNGAVTVLANIYGGQIGGGTNNSLSMASVGASVSTSFTVIAQ